MGAEGLEYTAKVPRKHRVAIQGGTESGTLGTIDPDLAKIAAAWPALSPVIRQAILAIVASAGGANSRQPV